MTDRPMQFSPPMVRALMEGRKTQTRRIAKPEGAGRWWQEQLPSGRNGWFCDVRHAYGSQSMLKNLYTPGDRLWVKETWRISPDACEGWHPESVPTKGWIDYRAGGAEEVSAPSFSHVLDAFGRKVDVDWDCLPDTWRPSLFMPRWASRLTLLVTDVRVERLQEISEEDAKAEGLEWVSPTYGIGGLAESWNSDPRESYRTLWNSLHGPDAWDANPWVVAVTFAAQRGNIDA
jgi:hypothetical protein